MGFLQTWTTAKKTFETKTKEKKPSDKFMGVFRKSSGLESACKALDDSLKAQDLAVMTKAEAGFRESSKAYAALLMTTSTKEKGEDYKLQLRTLEHSLYDIAHDFEKERDLVLRELFKRLEQQMEKVEQAAKNAQLQIMQLVDEVESQFQLCDANLRELVMAVSSRQSANVKKAIGALNNAFKAMVTQVGQIAKFHAEWDKKIEAYLRDCQAKNKELIKLFSNEFNHRKSEILTRPQAMKPRRERAEELLEDAKQLMVTANKAIKEGVDANQVFAASISKFAERARTLETFWENETTAFGSAMEEPENELDKALQETQEGTKERFERLQGIRINLSEQLKEVPVTRSGITKAQVELQKGWDRFPKEIRENVDFKEDVKIVEEAFAGLEDALKQLAKAELKINKLMEKVR